VHNLVELQPYGDDRQLRMVVETPRGSNIKLEYEPELHAFTVSRALPLGLVYPYDWGFIPGTKGEDGDPIDALAVHDGATYPGVILPCRPLGVVELVQKGANGPIENPRVILMPIWHDRLGELEKATDLPERVKAEIEQFFLSATFFTDKQAKITGWRGPKAAHRLISASLAGGKT
jgi:inorganic pyrophosphatase